MWFGCIGERVAAAGMGVCCIAGGAVLDAMWLSCVSERVVEDEMGICGIAGGV